MGRPIKKASLDVETQIRIIDASDGTPETGVDFDTGGIALWYRRDGAVQTAITEVGLSALNSAHAPGGIEPIGDGYYRLDLPSGACAAGAPGVLIGGTVTDMIVIGNYHTLVDYDPYDASGLGVSLIPLIHADTQEQASAQGVAQASLEAQASQLGLVLADTNVSVSALGIAQTDLNIITGEDGVLFASVQTNLDLIDASGLSVGLASYGGPTKTEMDNAHALLADASGLAVALEAYDGPTKTEMDTGHGTLIDASGLAVGLAAANLIDASGLAVGLETYDGPTKTEMDTGHGQLIDASGLAVGLGTYDGPTKGEMDTAHALLTDASGLAVGLAAYDGPTKTEMDDAHALLADASGLAVALAAYDGPTNTEMTVEHNVLEGEHAALSTEHGALATGTKQNTAQSDLDKITGSDGVTLATAQGNYAPYKGIVAGEAFSNFEFEMVASSDHITPKTGLTVAGYRSIDGGAFTGVTGVIAEVSNGIYQFDMATADTNGAVITFRFTGTDADDTKVTILTS